MGGVYHQVVRVTDFGPYVTKLILGMPREVGAEEISADQFSVYVTVRDGAGDIVKVPKSFIERDKMEPSQGYRPVSATYPCDPDGEEAEGKSRFVALLMPYGPIWKCSSALAADFSHPAGHEIFTVCDYRITQTAPIGEGEERLTGLVFDRCGGVLCPQRERFHQGVTSHAKMPLRYGYFVPDLVGGKRPLIVWLHGAGEGGCDTAIAYAGNKVPELTEPWVQEKFGGAFLFVPQCPTAWMDDGEQIFSPSGKSLYTEALKAGIDEFIERFGDAIDRDRIYVGGDSNGGFMTMRLSIDYPGFFAAAFPICEALLDERITDGQIQTLKEMPIWFTHAKNDPIVPPDKYAVPTYQRLMAAGAKNVHFTYWDKIIDVHEGFVDPEGKPYEYMGHFAWIPMLNDDCRVDFDGKPVVWDGREVSLLDWLAGQRK